MNDYQQLPALKQHLGCHRFKTDNDETAVKQSAQAMSSTDMGLKKFILFDDVNVSPQTDCVQIWFMSLIMSSYYPH
jgi:hypothetical protein